MQILRHDFYNRPTLVVAKKLLGCFLCKKETDGSTIKEMIIEVEAYDGFRDKASHAHRGETKRNSPMFGQGGFWYVYFTYGCHYMLNIVTGRKGYPAAVLIRGTSEISGPGRLAKKFGIDKSFNGIKADKKTGLWIEKGSLPAGITIKRTPRVGVAYAGKKWAGAPYRFISQ